MTKDIMSKLKLFKNDLKQFQKICKEDKTEGVKLGKKIIEHCKDIENTDSAKLPEKTKRQLQQVKDSINLYIQTVKSLEEFNKKWS
jgi:predicted transglutaminase-like cysteine proteinase